jgi:predicted enzyme related to lactoylglutathione lyase
VPVADQNRALEFYTKKLGLTVFTDQPFDDKQRWIELKIPNAQTKLVLFTADEHKDRVGQSTTFSLVVDNLERTYRELGEAGVEFLSPPTKQEWGSFATLLDSEGQAPAQDGRPMMIAVYIVGGIVALVAGLNLIGLALSRDWHVTRTRASTAPPANVYRLIASAEHGWPRWSPWTDPNATMTIVEADGNRRIRYSLTFGGFAIDGRIELGDGTITWTNDGTIGGLPMFRIGRLFARRVVGDGMDRGLANLEREALAA